MRKQIIIICAGCGKEASKQASEVKRNIQKERKSFCSASCSAKNLNNLGSRPGKGGIVDIRRFCHNRGDEFSPFKYYVNKARTRNKEYGFEQTNLTVEFLKELWDKQNGICPLSGWKMHMPATTLIWNSEPSHPKRASLDRITPRKPYNEDNVRFVCHIANMAKHAYSDEEVIAFCKAVADQNKSL